MNTGKTRVSDTSVPTKMAGSTEPAVTTSIAGTQLIIVGAKRRIASIVMTIWTETLELIGSLSATITFTGEEAARSFPEFSGVNPLCSTQGHKCKFPEMVVAEFVSWVRKLEDRVFVATRQNGVCVSPNPPMDRDGRREDSGRG